MQPGRKSATMETETKRQPVIIPANPGFWVWHIDKDQEEPLFGRQPIVVWCVRPFVVPRASALGERFDVHIGPITPDGMLAVDVVVEWPDGKFDFPTDCTFDNKKQAEDYVRERATAMMPTAPAK
jgi:hypothetical protein